MNTILIQALQFFCSLSLLVVLHEGGHYAFSKLFKVKVEKFYMFFNYKFHLFSTRDKWFTRLFPYFKNNETEYGIGWIPLGGYVKIAGMVDESMDTEQMKKPAQPDEFRSQSVVKRFFIMFGGVLMNFLTAWFIYSAMMFVWGRDYIPMRSIENGFQYNETAQSIGFQNKDLPIAADGQPIKEYNANVLRTISSAKTVTVLREGQEVDIDMPAEGLSLLTIMKMQPAFMSAYALAEIDSVLPGSSAESAGLCKGCRIVEANGHPIVTWADWDQEVTLRIQDVVGAPDCSAADSAKWRTIALVYQTPDGALDTTNVNTDEDYRMVVARKAPVSAVEHETYTFVQSIPAGLMRGLSMMKSYVSDLRYVASKEGAQSVGSFVTIANLFPQAWDWVRFWEITAFLSIILAVMNILPIPGLDGGHIAILFFEAITGHEPSEKVMEWIERIGIGLILCLMILAMSNDLRNIVLPWLGF